MLHSAQTPSIPELFDKLTRDQASAAALLHVQDDQTVTYTWSDLGRLVHCWVSALEEQGIRAGDLIVLWSANRFEWILTDLAAQSLGAVLVPLHNTVSGRQALDQIQHSGTGHIIVAGDEQLKKLAPLVTQLSRDWNWLTLDHVSPRHRVSTQCLSDLAKSTSPAHGAQLAHARLADYDIDAPTTIIYSSGTTGEPKGVTLSQRNLMSNAVALVRSFRADEPLETRLCFLPLSHIFARTCDVYTWLVRGSYMALAQNRDTIIDDCQRFAPTMINGVPYFFQRLHQTLVAKGVADESGKLKNVLGGQVRGCISGGAALPNETFDYFESQGIPLLQGYGLTETSPVISMSSLDIRKRGTAGKPLGNVEVKIAADGEILTRGPHVMLGYWQDPVATQEIIRDGWLHTGDLGELDDEGFLSITGRKKEIIVTATGKNVFPTHLEALLCRDPFVLQAIVIGNNEKYLSALIVPDPDALRAEIKAQRLWVFRRKSAVRHPHVRALFRERINQQLSCLSNYEQVRRFCVLDRGFLPENGHLTPKLSLRRDLIHRDFAAEINRLYDR